MKSQLLKWGNSLAIRIPKRAIKVAKLKEGDWLEIEAPGEGRMRLRRTDEIPALAELVAQITPGNRYPEI